MNETDTRDRAATIFKAEYANGDYNAVMEVSANRDGLMIDDGVFIPWEWLDRARHSLAQKTDCAQKW